MVLAHSINTNPNTNTNTNNTSTTSSTTTIPNDSKILCINFNQDQGCFAISHEQGFLVYNTDPIELRVKRNFIVNSHTTSSRSNHSNGSNSNNNHRNNSTGSNGSVSSLGSNNETTLGYKSTHKSASGSGSGSGSGIGHISMLHRTNYLALIGGGENPKFPINKLIIWDDLKRKTSLLLEFDTPVLNVLLSRV